ncbi:MAG: indolepyruvate ferredoxin oxidoreductase family protein [Pseudomonadota bacterium]
MTTSVRTVSLADKYLQEDGKVFLTGIQALVRLPLDQARMDRKNGLRTGGFISGYRGSPLGGFDQQLERNAKLLDKHSVVFKPGVNEELVATAVWGSQKLDRDGANADYDGVFGVWYGKAPGVDRASDVLKQANASGTARYGGVLAVAGDDTLAKSSILPAQSDFAFMNCEIPVLNPADIQEVLDYGLHGLALSRYSGLWAGLIALADTMDASAVISVDPERLRFVFPETSDPRRLETLNRPLLLQNRIDNERLVRDVSLPAAHVYVRANRLDRVAFGADNPRYGLITTGKAYRDLRQALDLIGITEDRAKAMGLAIYKVAMPWPLEPMGLAGFAKGLERVMVVEHKRGVLEPQIKEQMFHWPADQRPSVWGKTTPDGVPFLKDVLELAPLDLLHGLVGFMPELAAIQSIRDRIDAMEKQLRWAGDNATDAGRSPYFCSGCPHSTSTKTPEGSRAMPGIGCHAMTEINGRTTEGQVAMGGEGALWVGQAPFSKDSHVFANLGDGTYYHSGLLAIRQALSAKASITYKLLFNDAVAMTGGQDHDGPLTVPQITRQLEGEGVQRIVVVSERPHLYDSRSGLAPGVPVLHRDELPGVQEELSRFKGVSVIVYDQTCAAEKRRRRKKGLYEDPGKRLMINERVCEGCGDCSVQSNCLSVEPLATPFGEKRTINQSSCNMDFSCVKGFCPSFVWVEGGTIRKQAEAAIDLDALVKNLPTPDIRVPAAPVNLLFAGIGGMGVTTAGSVLAMAAHLDGLNASTLDMTGLAQKGGPVTSHVRFSSKDRAIEGPRVPTGGLDVLVASDMLVANTADVLALADADRTLAVANTEVAPTAEFAMRQTLSFEGARLKKTLGSATRDTTAFNAAKIGEKLFGDSIFANMLLIGAAWQKGALPFHADAMENAIRLNGAAVDKNIQAFRAGRVLGHDAKAFDTLFTPATKREDQPLDERIAFLAHELAAYQNDAYAARFTAAIDKVKAADEAFGQGSMRLTRNAAENLYKLMAYKDEYEVARLYSDPKFIADLSAQFDNVKKLKVMLAPPMLSPTDPATGRPKKRAFGPWVFTAFKALTKMRGLRGTRFDPFGYTEERRKERALIETFEADLKRIVGAIGAVPYGLAAELARVPDMIRGYGPVKETNMEKAAARRASLLARFEKEQAPAELPQAAE